MTIDTRMKLEQAAFSAWPALETQQLDNWALRFADGYTKRANSANAKQAIGQLTDQQLDAIEAFFHARQQPPIFRLASFAIDPAIDEKLIQRGYQFNDLSLVMATTTAMQSYQPDAAVELLGVEAWLKSFQQISGKTGSGQATHLRMLQSIASPYICVVIREAGQAVCCGLAVVSEGCIGLFDIVTDEAFRQRGLAKKLCDTLLHWGAEQGADTAYLQVVANNKAAINLYESMGFRRAYEYWYRVGKGK